MWGFRSTPKRTVAAVVYRKDLDAFFVAFDSAAGVYELPMRGWSATISSDPVVLRNSREETAIEALQDAMTASVGRADLTSAAALWMDVLPWEPTATGFEIVTVDPGCPLPEGRLGSACGFMPYAQIKESPLVGAATQAILDKLLEEQRVALAAVSRRRHGEREFLMTRNRHGQYFFPAKRQRHFTDLQRAIVAEFKDNANYAGKVVAREWAVAEVMQRTPHLGERRYFFHVFQTEFPPYDLNLGASPLEEALGMAGIDYRWFPLSQLEAEGEELSHTVCGVLEAVRGVPESA